MEISEPNPFTPANIGIGLGVVALGLPFLARGDPVFTLMALLIAIAGVAVSVHALQTQRRAGARIRAAVTGIAVSLIALAATPAWLMYFLWLLSQVDWGPPCC